MIDFDIQYTQLPSSYKYDTIADAIYAREVEFFHYNFDLINFKHLLSDLSDGEFKTDIQNRLEATLQQMKNVAAIITALKSQIDDENEYKKAVTRATKRRKARDVK